MDNYQTYIAKSRYAKYLYEENRRENFNETVERYLGFWEDKLDDETHKELEEAINNLEVMPSMRALMTAGPALEKSNVAGFNCSYFPIDHPRAFDELMFILLNGTGVGFSVERKYVDKLPVVAEEFHPTDTVINVADSKIGWAKAYKELISLLYSGQVPQWDVSKVREAGAPLKTFGGRASGPEPLVNLFRFTVEIFQGAAGRQLTTLECHDLCCKVAEIVVVGGVRRSALISLSNLTDDRIRNCKHGNFGVTDPQRYLSNNSVAYTVKPDFVSFMTEWGEMYKSYAGERGFFSRPASQKQAAKNGRRDPEHEFGTNPCSEIILRPNQFCNLSEVVIRPEDTYDSLARKVRLATILGTLQATLTNFPYLRKKWKDNTEEEALLGVSLTGIMDHPFMSTKQSYSEDFPRGLRGSLKDLKQVAIDTNKEWAERLGINQSTAITCIKPSGTVSQLVDSASGIHGRFAPYYIRRVRAASNDPLCEVLKEGGVPWEYQCSQGVVNNATTIFSFPIKSPEGSVMANEQSGLEQLKVWSIYQEHWCEHKPSITVYYRDEEFLEIGNWLYNNFDDVSGVSFLPYDGHVYEQAPYEPITKEEYENLLAEMPVNFTWDIREEGDNTEGSQTLACVGGACEI